MRRPFITRSLLVMLVGAVIVGTIAAVAATSNARPMATLTVADVPEFRGNAARTGEMSGSGPGPSAEVLWRFGEAVTSAPASDGDSLYVGTSIGVVALNVADGTERWRWTTGTQVSAAPVVGEEIIYAGGAGNLYALDARTGMVLWQVPVGGVGELILIGDALIVSSFDGRLLALDAASGAERWQVSLLRGALTRVDATVFLLNEAGLFAIDPANGAFHWQYSPTASLSTRSIAVGQHIYVSDLNGDVHAVDAAAGEPRWIFVTDGIAVVPGESSGEVVHISSSDGTVYGVDANSGAERWQINVATDVVETSVAAGILYVIGSDGTKAALDAASGALRWRLDGGNNSSASGLTIIGGVGYSVMSGTLRAWNLADGAERWQHGVPAGPQIVVTAGMVIASGTDGRLHAIDAVTGAERWTFATGGPIRSWPAVWQDLVLTGSDDGYLYAVEVATGLERWRLRTGGEIAGSLAIANNSVFFTNGAQKLYAVDAATGAPWWSIETAVFAETVLATNGSQLFVVAGSSLTAHDAASGAWLWSASPEGGINAFPVVTGDSVYVANSEGFVYRYAIEDGAEMSWWRFTAGGVYSGLAVSDGAVFFESDDGTLYAIEIESGDQRWTVAAGGSFDSTPAIANGLVYAAVNDGRIDAIGTSSGFLEWRSRPLPEGISLQNPIIAGDLMLAHLNGQIVAIGPTTLACPVGTPSVDTERAYMVIGGGADVRTEPDVGAAVAARLADGTLVEGIGPAVELEGTSWWPVRDHATNVIGYVQEASLLPLGCAQRQTFAGPPATPPPIEETESSELASPPPVLPATPIAATAVASPIADQGSEGQLPDAANTGLEALLPSAAELPVQGLVMVNSGERTRTEVASTLGSGEAGTHAEQFLTEVGWTANVFSEFAGEPGTLPLDTTSFLSVSIHEFTTDEDAREALSYFSDVVVDNLGYDEVQTDPIGDEIRFLRGVSEDGSTNVVAYVVDGPLLYRIAGSSPAGDPTENVLGLATTLIGRSIGRAVEPATAACTAESNFQPGTIVVTSDDVNFRTQATSESPAIMLLPASTRLRVTGAVVDQPDCDWYSVTDPATGESGFVRGDFLEGASE